MRFLCCLLLATIIPASLALGEVRLLTGDANNQLHNRDSLALDLSQDGRLVLFSSGPPVTGSTPGITQGGLYIRDLVADTLTFSGATNVAGEASFSDDGRFVTWTAPGFSIYWRDCQAGETRLLASGTNGGSRNPIMSADGRYVAFASVARNLVPNTNHLPANGRAAVYLYDSLNQTTTVASLTHDGKGLSTGVGLNAPSLEFNFSANGQYVFFSTDATNVHPARATAASQAYYWLYRRHVQNGVVEVVCKNATNGIPIGNFTTPFPDATGNRVLFAGGFVGLGGGPLLVDGYSFVFGTDLYLKDLTTAEVWWVTRTTNSTTPDAAFGSGAMALSGDGKVVAFGSSGTKFVLENTDPPGASDSFDIFRVDIGPAGNVTNSLITKSVVGSTNVGYFSGPLLSANGNYVAFNSGYHRPFLGVGEYSSIHKHGFGVGTLPGATTPAPALHFLRSGNQIILNWINAAGFNLYSSTNLALGNWSLVPNTPALVNGTNSLTLPMIGPVGFFQLRSP
jgi:Tol biopolymer transport system component